MEMAKHIIGKSPYESTLWQTQQSSQCWHLIPCKGIVSLSWLIVVQLGKDANLSSISLEYIMVSPTEVLWKMSFTEILNVALVSVGHLDRFKWNKGTIQESRYHRFISSSQVVPSLLVEATSSKCWWDHWKRTLSFTRANVWQEDLSSSGHQLHICWCPRQDRSTCRNVGASEIPCSSSFSTTSSTQAHTYTLASLLAVKERHER